MGCYSLHQQQVTKNNEGLKKNEAFEKETAKEDVQNEDVGQEDEEE